MSKNDFLLGAASIVGIVFAIYNLRKWLRYRYLQQHGYQATATILEAQLIQQPNSPLMRLDLEYKTVSGARQKVRLFAPYADDRDDYIVGVEVHLIYDPLHPNQCELVSVLYSSWWNSPLLTAITLGGASLCGLWGAL